LVAIGVALLLRQRDQSIKPPIITGPISGSSNENGPNSFDDFVIFGGREIFINAQSLHSGKATSIFGGIEFDLRKASMAPGGAIIDCVSVFGGCGFKIPMDWNVRNEVTTIFGAFTDKRGDTYNERYYDPSKTLVIKGVSIFGGVEVKHF
jgi:predicted membrane protein